MPLYYVVRQFPHLEYYNLASQNGSATDVLINHDAIGNLDDAALLDITSLDFENEFDTHYGLLAPEQTVVVRAYS